MLLELYYNLHIFKNLVRLGITTASGLEMVLEANEAAFPGHSHSLQQKGNKNMHS